MTSDAHEKATGTRWYLGSMNDGLFIIDEPPRPSTDDVWPDPPDGPNMALALGDLPLAKAQAIIDAHNASLSTYQGENAGLIDRLTNEAAAVEKGGPLWGVDETSRYMREAALALSAQDAKVAEAEKRQAPALALLRQSYVTLAFAFRRLHESSRSRDGELCQDFQKVRAQIERHFKEAGVKL